MNPCILLPEMEKRFALDTKLHIMEVRKCDGMYRHLYFRNPDYFPQWFEIVTFPTMLVFHGDVGTYCFSCRTDMFDFFRNRTPDPKFFADKLCTPDGNVLMFSWKDVTEHIEKEFKEFCDLNGVDWTSEDLKEYQEELKDNILDNCMEETAYQSMNFQKLESGFIFDPCEIDPRIYTEEFLWACCAIPWAVAKFDEHQKEHGK